MVIKRHLLATYYDNFKSNSAAITFKILFVCHPKSDIFCLIRGLQTVSYLFTFYRSGLSHPAVRGMLIGTKPIYTPDIYTVVKRRSLCVAIVGIYTG
jgi:hypothetical protein